MTTMFKNFINSLTTIPSASSSTSRIHPKTAFPPSRSVHSSTLRLRAPVPTSPISPIKPSTNGAGVVAAAPGGTKSKPRSGHMVWYREIVPAMLPVFLLSTTVFLSLSLIRTHLSHSLSLTESSQRIAELEDQLAKVRRDQRKIRDKERKERERILPLVVERVLQRVGAMRGDEEGEVEDAKDGERLLV